MFFLTVLWRASWSFHRLQTGFEWVFGLLSARILRLRLTITASVSATDNPSEIGILCSKNDRIFSSFPSELRYAKNLPLSSLWINSSIAGAKVLAFSGVTLVRIELLGGQFRWYAAIILQREAHNLMWDLLQQRSKVHLGEWRMKLDLFMYQQ